MQIENNENTPTIMSGDVFQYMDARGEILRAKKQKKKTKKILQKFDNNNFVRVVGHRHTRCR